MRVTHRDGAILGAILVTNLFISKTDITLINTIPLITGSILGGYICDIDEPKSYIGRKFSFLLWPFYLSRTFINMIAMLPSPFKRNLTQVSKVLKHKGITHTPFIWLLGGLLYVTLIKSYLNSFLMANFTNINVVTQCLQFLNIFTFGLYIGITTHILLDFISEGIMLFFPFSIKRFSLSLIRTGSSAETIIHILIIITNLYFLKNYVSTWY